MGPSVGVIIVNYRTAKLVIDCLRSLEQEVAASSATRVVVVDNASGDGSPEHLSEAIRTNGWSHWASVLPLAVNGGFSAGNNAGIRLLREGPVEPDWFWLLNPDTVVHPGALAALVERGQSEPKAGIVGSRLEDPDGTPQHSVFRFHALLTELDGALRLGVFSKLIRPRALVLPHPSRACTAEWVSGASLLVRRELLDEVGLLDDGYFLYYEEVDFCLRAARARWQCWHEPTSRVVHLVGKSTGVDPSAIVRRVPPYVLESRRRYFVKNHGFLYAALADAVWVMGHLAWRLRMWLQRRPTRSAPHVLRDFLGHSVWMRGARG
ncbi:MAG: glycosyltransferase family 2 protein [Myxococcaceae bacterium]|nr:glycosyltransferase family 2 protein [Myxococcaceae bacterium]